MIRFRVKVGKTLHSIPLIDIAYLYSEDSVTYIVMHNGARYILSMSLKEIMILIQNHGFFQINRSFVVSHYSLKSVNLLEKGNSSYRLTLQPGFKEPVFTSKDRNRDFKNWLGHPYYV